MKTHVIYICHQILSLKEAHAFAKEQEQGLFKFWHALAFQTNTSPTSLATERSSRIRSLPRTYLFRYAPTDASQLLLIPSITSQLTKEGCHETPTEDAARALNGGELLGVRMPYQPASGIEEEYGSDDLITSYGLKANAQRVKMHYPKGRWTD